MWSGKRHEINERSEFMNDPAKRRRRRWSGVSDMNDCEKAVTCERRNEGDYNAGVPEKTSSTLWDVRRLYAVLKVLKKVPET